MKALQFIGTQRSGSNLLRVMLHQHSRICAPHPPHILQHFFPLIDMYGDLSDKKNFSELTDDVCTLVETNPVSWRMKFNRETVKRRCTHPSLPQLLNAVYELKAEEKGADIWACKSMTNVAFVDEIEKAAIHPFYIHIYRDGRDAAVSFLQALVGEKHVYHLAKQWEHEQQLAMQVCAAYPDRSIAIRYEEFILDPERYVRDICDKLKIDFESTMLDYSSSQESKETASAGEMWGNLVKPVIRNNTGKFLTQLNEEQIAIFESVAGKTLEALEYPMHSDATFIFTDANIRSFDEVNKAGKGEARGRANVADIEKRKEQDQFIDSLKRKWKSFSAEKVS